MYVCMYVCIYIYRTYAHINIYVYVSEKKGTTGGSHSGTPSHENQASALLLDGHLSQVVNRLLVNPGLDGMGKPSYIHVVTLYN